MCFVFIEELPRAPGQLQLTSVQSRSAELQWLDEDIDPLLEYRVQLTRPGTIGWTFNQTIEARGRSLVTLPHLHPFTFYEVQVNAINSAGIGPPSSRSTSVPNSRRSSVGSRPARASGIEIFPLSAHLMAGHYFSKSINFN